MLLESTLATIINTAPFNLEYIESVPLITNSRTFDSNNYSNQLSLIAQNKNTQNPRECPKAKVCITENGTYTEMDSETYLESIRIRNNQNALPPSPQLRPITQPITSQPVYPQQYNPQQQYPGSNIDQSGQYNPNNPNNPNTQYNPQLGSNQPYNPQGQYIPTPNPNSQNGINVQWGITIGGGFRF
jgi:hypothetical protein